MTLYILVPIPNLRVNHTNACSKKHLHVHVDAYMLCTHVSACTCTCMYTVVSRVSAHGRLNKLVILARMQDKTTIRLNRSYYSGPLKCGTWALTWEWVLAQVTMIYMYKCIGMGISSSEGGYHLSRNFSYSLYIHVHCMHKHGREGERMLWYIRHQLSL